jgi:HPt (histidine-containing phosphotransfer) domain-containing protein
MLRLLLMLSLWMAGTAFAVAPSIDLIHAKDTLLVSEQATWLQSDADISQIVKQSFLPNKDFHHLGYRNDNFWFRLILSNQGDSDIERVITLRSQHVHNLKAYLVVDGITDDITDKRERRMYPTLSVKIPAHKEAVFYLRARFTHQLEGTFTIATRETFLEQDVSQSLIPNLFLGLDAGLIIYNMMLFLTLRFRTYFLYLAFIMAFTVTTYLLHGFYFPMFGEDPYPGSLCLFANITLLFNAQFTRWFLDTRIDKGFLDRMLLTSGIVSFIISLAVVFSHNYALLGYISDVNIFIYLTIMILVAGIKSFRGHLPARYYLFSCSITAFFLNAWILRRYGFLDLGTWAEYGPNLGLATQMIIISFGMGELKSNVRQQIMKQLEDEKVVLEALVKKRTSEIAQKSSQMQLILKEIDQGIFMLDNNLRLENDSSRHLSQIIESDQLVGKTLRIALLEHSDLSEDEQGRILSALTFAFDGGQLGWELNENQLPREISFLSRSGSSKILEVNWQAIVEGDEVKKVLVTLRDVSEVKALRFIAESQQLEMQRLGEIIHHPVAYFQKAMNNLSLFISANRGLLEEIRDIEAEHLQIMARNIHTFKGEARSLGFKRLAELAHKAENGFSMAAPSRKLFLEDLKTIEDSIHAYRETGYHKLGHPKLDRVTSKALPENISEVSAQGLESILRTALASIPSLALDLGKETPVIRFYDSDIRFEPRANRIFENVFLHLFRNSLDHGIESRDTRLERGKQAYGIIQIEVFETDGVVFIHYRDDGRGLDLLNIRKKAIETGYLLSDDDLTLTKLKDLICRPGFSSAKEISEFSGRGIGMNAIQSFLADVDCELSFIPSIVVPDKLSVLSHLPFSMRIRVSNDLVFATKLKNVS